MAQILNATLNLLANGTNTAQPAKNHSCHGTGSMGSMPMKMSGHNHHAHHNHGLGDDDNSTDMMIMYFHGGYKETILFDFWRTRTIAVFLISCLLMFLLAVAYEGLKYLREAHIQYELRKKSVGQARSAKASNNNKNECCQHSNNANNTHEEKLALSNEDDSLNAIRVDEIKSKQAANLLENQYCKCDPDRSVRIVFQEYSSRLLSAGHVTQTLLHMAQITVSYFLMLVFMTYNSWLCLSVILGAGLGYFLFGLKRLTAVDVNEHCH